LSGTIGLMIYGIVADLIFPVESILKHLIGIVQTLKDLIFVINLE